MILSDKLSGTLNESIGTLNESIACRSWSVERELRWI